MITNPQSLKPGYRNRNPQSPWLVARDPYYREQVEAGRYPHGSLKLLPALSLREVHLLITGHTLTQEEADDIYASLLDQRQPLTLEAEPYRTALLQKLRLRARGGIQAVEVCPKCGSYEFLVERGQRTCAGASCRWQWYPKWETREVIRRYDPTHRRQDERTFRLVLPDAQSYQPRARLAV